MGFARGHFGASNFAHRLSATYQFYFGKFEKH